MASRLMERTERSGVPGSSGGHEECFCPECGQSLDLSRHGAMPTGQRTLEPYIFAIFGLALVVMFGINAWYAHRAMVAIDQQVADSRASIAQGAYGSASDQESVVAPTVTRYLTERLPIQQKFDHDIGGLALGVVAITVGVGTWVRQRCRFLGPTGLSHRGLQIETLCRLWDLSNRVTRPLLWAVVMLCVGLYVGHIIRGEPLTLDLMNRALERTVEVVVTIARALL